MLCPRLLFLLISYLGFVTIPPSHFSSSLLLDILPGVYLIPCLSQRKTSKEKENGENVNMVLWLKFGQRLAHINEVHISECPSSPCWMQIAKGYLHARHGGVVATSCLIFKFQCSAPPVTAQGGMSLDGLTY